MKRLLLILVFLLCAVPACAITHVVQHDSNGHLSGSPQLTLPTVPSAGHVLLSFSQADNANAVIPADTSSNVWNLLYTDVANGVGRYNVYWAIANGTGTTYTITWACSTFFTHSVGFVIETDFTGIVPTVTTDHGTSTGFSVSSTQGSTFGMTQFNSNPTIWQATLLRMPIVGGWYVGFLATNIGSGWNGVSRVNLSGTIDYMIDAWSGVFDVTSTDPLVTSKRRRSQVY